MAVQKLKCLTGCCCSLLLVFLLCNAVAATNGTGNEATTHEGHNYPTVINERTRRDVSALVDSTTTLQPLAYNNDNDKPNAADNKDKHNLPFNVVGNPLRTLNIVKRTPSGFTGMRGKKEYEYSDYSNANNLAMDDDHTADWDIDPIQQVAYENELNEAYGHLLDLEPRFKKAPSTFYGVRGKKYSDYNINRVDSLIQRLEEDRLRQSLIQNFIRELVNRQAMSQNDVTKRAPTGFTGMRGKRPAMVDYLFNGEDGSSLAEPFEEDKRGPVNAFMGVRGKKDVNHQAFKRSPLEFPYFEIFNIFSQSGNRRSKSQRFVDFNNKFVAVRGKKDDDSSNTFADETHQGYYVNNMPLLALHGIRGKRAIATPAETEQTPYKLAVEDLHALKN
ncbi:tachykinins isoform X1 [Zeugodacus cucurbitae]|uniref:tachykinins isoform X1 n=1 Tax=Zeugodacus cucurbitae TaxID=28588 RepID=UPI0023D911B0|nr:tachykinins isoform X1 [Zeugodacus cucurbitae]XP_054081288.1 tachykinins isoform X1 [Zeugodacus cucurbitae]